MDSVTDERWPVIYDAAELDKTIRRIIDSDPSERNYIKNFYTSVVSEPVICQGDIIELASKIPVIDRSGVPATLDLEVSNWLVLGNTCDFQRDSVHWTSICPVISTKDLPDLDVEAAKRYRTSRTFYLRPWAAEMDTTMIADLTMVVTVDKKCMMGVAKPLARLGHSAWVLLHCCLVRFLGRDDGRFD